MHYKTIGSLFACVLTVVTAVQAQVIEREMYLDDIHMDAMYTLSQDGAILGRFLDPRTPIVSYDSGRTYHQVLSAGELLDIGNKTMISADGNGHGLISGDIYRLLTSDAGATWEKVDGGLPLEPRGFQLQTDGNGIDLYLIGDYGRIKRPLVLPDTFPDRATWEGVVGYSYGRGSLTRTTDGSSWYCIDHETGEFTLRSDFPPVKSYRAGELASGAKMFAFMPKFGKILVCLPGDTCKLIDSLLDSYGVMSMYHFNDYVVQSFSSGSQVVILGADNYRIIDARKIILGSSGHLRVAACNSSGLVVFTSDFCAFVPHDGSPPIVVSVSALSLDGVFALVGKKLTYSSRYNNTVTIDFNDGSVRLTGRMHEQDKSLSTRTRVRDIFPNSNHCIAYYNDGTVLDIDTLNNAPFRVAFASAGRVSPELINPYEAPSLALQRTDALFGCSSFTSITNDITASGTPNGIRIEDHGSKTATKALADTVTTIVPLNNGSVVVAAHRKAWLSSDTGKTWHIIETPNLGTVISGYATTGGNTFIGYRGFVNTVNDSVAASTPGGVYMQTSSGVWSQVNAIPNNYIYRISVDSDGTLWVVGTNATLDHRIQIVDGDTTITQINALQDDITVYRSKDAGVTWQLLHTEPVRSSFEAITGAVSQASNGHIVAMPQALLYLPTNADTFDVVNILPFGTKLSSARLDQFGHAWIAASNGLFEVDLSKPTSIREAPYVENRTLSIVPNPVLIGSHATIRCQPCNTSRYIVHDVLGNVVGQDDGSTFSAQGYAPGVYFLSIGNQVIRVVVQ